MKRLPLLLVLALTACGQQSQLQSLELSPKSNALKPQGTWQYSLVGKYSDGTTQELSGQAEWTTSDSKLATISEDGKLEAIAPGKVIVTAKYGETATAAELLVTPSPLIGLELQQKTFSLPIGVHQELVLTGVHEDHTRTDLSGAASYVSSVETVAKVNGANVLAIGEGSTTITATYGELTVTADVLVTNAVLETITVSPSSASVAAGFSQNFAAMGVYTDGSQRDLTHWVSWTTSDSNVAAQAVESAGFIVTQRPGAVSVTASIEGKSATATLTVTEALLQHVSISPSTVSMPVGVPMQFVVNGEFSDGSKRDLSNEVSWESSDPTVASYMWEGTFLPAMTGTANINIVGKGFSAQATLRVTDPVMQTLTIQPPTTGAIPAGLQQPLSVIGTWSDGSQLDVTAIASWSSSDPLIAEVSDVNGQKGLVTAKAIGTVDITAALYGTATTFQVQVSAPTVKWLEVSIPQAQLAKNTQLKLHATAVMSDGSRQDVTSSALWSVNDATVAEVAQGVVTAKLPGAVQVTAAYENASVISGLTVSDANLTSISLNPMPSPLQTGASVTEVVTASFDDGTTQDVTAFATWTSSDVNVATVSSFAGTEGVVVAVGQGSAQLTASYLGVSGVVVVQVAP